MAKRLKGEGSIRERKDGRFEAKIQVGKRADGKPAMKYFYGETKREAKAKLDEYVALTKAGEERNTMTLETYIMNWLHNVKKNELKPLSYDTLETTIKTHITPRIGFYGIQDLTNDIIQKELINNLAKSTYSISEVSSEKKTYSYSTIKKTYDALNACLKFATTNRIIPYNPMQSVVKPSQNHFKTKTIEILTDIEIETLYKTSIKYGRHGHAIILILYTGIRMGEALGLKWNDYNEKERTLTIDGSLVIAKNRSGKEDQPNYKLLDQDTAKTKKGKRKIYLSAKALTALNELHKYNFSANLDNSIISTKNNTPLRPRNLQTIFDNILRRAEIPHKGLHTLRHTFASMLIRKGVDIKIVSELLGHADVSFTYNTYVHIIEEQKSTAIQKLDEL